MPMWPFGSVEGGVRLYDGFMKGLETIQRIGDATLSHDSTAIYFSAELGINYASMGYGISITFMDIGPRGTMSGTITYAHFYFMVRSSKYIV